MNKEIMGGEREKKKKKNINKYRKNVRFLVKRGMKGFQFLKGFRLRLVRGINIPSRK